MKRKILYISLVNWNSMKQRPQFIAEGLRKYFDVYVYHCSSVKDIFTNRKNDTNIIPLYDIPKKHLSKVLTRIDIFLKKIKIINAVKKIHPDYIWLSSPKYVDCIPNNYNGKIVYDCMDNHVFFEQPDWVRNNVIQAEKKLISKADYVFVTSKKLKHELISRYGCDESSLILNRNAYNGNLMNFSGQDKEIDNKPYFTCAYFGYIGSWFDFEVIDESLNRIPELRYLFVGHLDGSIKPLQHERIQYIGVVPHEKLYDTIKNADCLIMPFIVNPLIESVDPVKMYEYINFNKNIISVYYPEMDRYNNFCHFYNTKQQFVEQVTLLMSNRIVKYSNDERVSFLSDNTWECRCAEIYKVLMQK